MKGECWWFMPVIIATGDVENQRIMVLDKTRQKKAHETPHLNGKKLDTVVHACYLKYSGMLKIEESGFIQAWAQKENLYPR
jgi:hypothetical protein